MWAAILPVLAQASATQRESVMTNNTKTVLGGAIVAFALSSPAFGHEAPFLYGDYSANVERSVNPQVVKNPTTRSTWTTAYGFGRPSVDEERPVGNYSANVRMHDIRGK
jgi:hypothetical protein